MRHYILVAIVVVLTSTFGCSGGGGSSGSGTASTEPAAVPPATTTETPDQSAPASSATTTTETTAPAVETTAPAVGSRDVTPNLKLLAKNVIFRRAEAARTPKAIKAIEAEGGEPIEVDATTRVYADNVVFEESGRCTIDAPNVQQFLQELCLDLGQTIVGTWTIENKHRGQYHADTGLIEIRPDGTFNLIEGSFAAIGMKNGTGNDLCRRQQEGQRYEIIANKVVIFSHVNLASRGEGEPITNVVLPTIADLKSNEIVFYGSGGCGELGRTRVSILRRRVQ